MKVFTLKSLIRIAVVSAGAVAVLGFLCSELWGRIESESSRINRPPAIQVAKPIDVLQSSQAAPDFYTEYRLDRERLRSERLDLLREAMRTAKTEDSRQRLQEAILKLAMEKQREAEIEGLIKARGFAEALVMLRDNTASVVLKASSLSKDEVLQIADCVSRLSGVKAEDIVISAKP